MQDFDLTGGEVKVLGNGGDTHLFRLSNPVGQTLIASGVAYECEFTSHLGADSPVTLDTTRLPEGILTIPVLMRSGIYRVRRVDPRRTLLTIEVETQ